MSCLPLSCLDSPESKPHRVSATLWIASKICSNECPVAKAVQLERLIGVHRLDIVEMERWLVRHQTRAVRLPARRLALTDCRALQLCGLRADMQPVTDNDMCSVLLPFTFCSREERPRLVQYTENILLAMNLGAQFVALSSTLGRVVLPDAACAPQCILCWLSTRPPEPSARWFARPC